MIRTLTVLACLAFTLHAAAQSSPAPAGQSQVIVVLKDGSRFNGTLTSQDSASFTVMTSNGVRRVPRGSVESFEPTESRFHQDAPANHPAEATSSMNRSETHLGFGVGFSPRFLAIVLDGSGNVPGYIDPTIPVALTNFSLPIRMASVTLEPEIGIMSDSYHHDVTQTGGSSAYVTNDINSISLIRLGAGLIIPVKRFGMTEPYVGGRAGIILVSTSDESKSSGGSQPASDITNTFSQTNAVVGVMFGGEHFLSEHFSLGCEAQLNGIFFGNPSRSHTPASPSTSTNTSSETIISSNVVLFARVYL
jgi:small nuclear ribonucleoprotein (snRNP)-like protein